MLLDNLQLIVIEGKHFPFKDELLFNLGQNIAERMNLFFQEIAHDDLFPIRACNRATAAFQHLKHAFALFNRTINADG
ncbi:hypothetical protein D3C85_1650900 [compost metagenome]